MQPHVPHLLHGALEIVLDDIPFLVANVGRVADGPHHLHRLEYISIHLWYRPVHFSCKPRIHSIQKVEVRTRVHEKKFYVPKSSKKEVSGWL